MLVCKPGRFFIPTYICTRIRKEIVLVIRKINQVFGEITKLFAVKPGIFFCQIRSKIAGCYFVKAKVSVYTPVELDMHLIRIKALISDTSRSMFVDNALHIVK